MKSKKLKVALYVIAAVVLVLIGFVLYYYQQGGVQNYFSPEEKHATYKEQARADLTTLSSAIEAYYGMNLLYPDSLVQLMPDFVKKLPSDPITGKMYTYTTDGTSKYAVGVSDAEVYQLKELAVENGKVIER